MHSPLGQAGRRSREDLHLHRIEHGELWSASRKQARSVRRVCLLLIAHLPNCFFARRPTTHLPPTSTNMYRLLGFCARDDSYWIFQMVSELAQLFPTAFHSRMSSADLEVSSEAAHTRVLLESHMVQIVPRQAPFAAGPLHLHGGDLCSVLATCPASCSDRP